MGRDVGLRLPDQGKSACGRAAGRWIALVGLLVAGASAAPVVRAHEIAVSIAGAKATFGPDGKFSIAIELDREHSILHEGEPVPTTARGMDERGGQLVAKRFWVRFDDRPADFTVELKREADAQGPGMPSRALLQGSVPTGAKHFQFGGAFAQERVVLQVTSARDKGAQPRTQTWSIDRGVLSAPIPLEASAGTPGTSAWQLLLDFVGVGFKHILPLGIDHVLFMLGLFLLTPQWKPLLLQVSAFTLAHTLSLGLSLYGWVDLPSGFVESVIAASIVLVALDNIRSTRLSLWRPVVVVGFGLLHGLGFAGVLKEQLPNTLDSLLPALIGFNLGV